MATARPTAVVISASAIPADTDARPPPPLEGSAIIWKAVMIPNTVPNRPTNGAEEDTVASTGKPRRRLASSRSLTRSMRAAGGVDHDLQLGRIGGPGSQSFYTSDEFADAGADDLGDRAAAETLLEAHRLT